jgi:hypothetical protein
MVRTFAAYLDFCYLVRMPVINEETLTSINNALDRFYTYRPVFQPHQVREPGPAGFNLPRQHAMKHYPELIVAFAAPNGLCSSMTENMHIRAVKKPWRRSGRHNALGQMLLTNQRLVKLSAARVDFQRRGMLQGSCLSALVAMLGSGWESDDSDGSVSQSSLSVPRTTQPLTTVFGARRPELREIDWDDSDDEDEQEDRGPVDGPTVVSHVELARSKGEYHSICYFIIIT